MRSLDGATVYYDGAAVTSFSVVRAGATIVPTQTPLPPSTATPFPTRAVTATPTPLPPSTATASPTSRPANTSTPVPSPTATTTPSTHSIYLGVHLDGVPWDMTKLAAYETEIGKPVSIVHYWVF
ncbi:MAG TPA: hypothetical protein VGA61_15450 [Anaerolineae bacterium]